MTPEILLELYRDRRCFICLKKFWCAHREPQVDLAECYARYTMPVLRANKLQALPKRRKHA